MKRGLHYKLLALCLGAFICISTIAQDAPIAELEAFISEETSAEDTDSLLPTERSIDSVFFADMSILETPRSVLTISPETMKQFQIKNFDDLAKIGAGTERVNFYGIAGAPVIRGWQGGTYFNGMQRAFQRNEMPTSFGSLDALNIIKGPAPAQYSPSHVGGYANMIPKSPYFDEFRGSVKLEVGSWSYFNVQADVGEPTLIFGLPSAYRISITAQQSESFYDRINNDYFSIYGAIKTRVSDTIRIFTGAEYFQFKSNENAGWNRPSQNLIDNGEYVIGEPLSLVRASNGGVAERGIIDGLTFDFGGIPAENRPLFRALVVPEAVVDTSGISDDLKSLLVDMSDSATRDLVYTGTPDDIARTTSGYVYTPEYFQAGGTVFTTPIDASTVLSDDADFADSLDFIYFFDIIGTPSEDFTWTNKFFFEYLETRKLSSYGYGFDSDQMVIADRLIFTNDLELGGIQVDLGYGAELRYSEALQLQDFWTEPFARRDISTGFISANSVILAGPQVDPNTGNNYWGGGFGAGGPGGHAAKSELLQGGLFAYGDVEFSDMFSVLFGLRQEFADYETVVPDQPTDIADAEVEGDIDFFNWSINPVLKLTDEVSLYGAYQEATTIVPTQGGAILGDGNFGDAELIEYGAKFSLIEDTLFASVAYYEWEQTSFSDREATSDQFESEGFEVEMTWKPTDSFTLIASFDDRETKKVSDLNFRTVPFSLMDPTGAGNEEIGIALESGILGSQFSAAVGGFTPEGGSPSGNPDQIVPGFPETTLKLFGIYEFDNGFGVSGGASFRSDYYHNYDRTLLIDESTIVNANIFYKAEKYEVIISVENLTGEDYFVGSDPEFAANTLITKAPDEPEFRLTFTYFFD